MTKEAVAELFRAAQANPSLRDQLNQAPTVADFIALAKTHGYDFTLEEWQAMTGFAVEELPSDVSEIPGL